MLLVKSPCIWHHCSISCSKDKLEELLIPRLELDGGRKPHIVRYTMTKKLKPYTQCRHSMFERVNPISERLALHMLEVGYKQPSRFGRWCPVKVYCFCFCHILNLSLFFFMETKLAKLESLMFPNKSTRFRRRKWHICIYTKQVINTNKVSPDAAGNVVTSGGDGKVASVHQTVNNDPVKVLLKSNPKQGNPVAQSHYMW